MELAAINRRDRHYSIETICDAFSLKRDAYYKYQKRFVIKKQIEKKVVELVKESRLSLIHI